MNKFILGQKVLCDNRAVGVVASVNSGTYSVATSGGIFSYTEESLKAYWDKSSSPQLTAPTFIVGQRVFYSDYTHSPPLGVVTGIDWMDDNNQEVVTVRWDNEVISVHDPRELHDVEGTIRALSQPIPQE